MLRVPISVLACMLLAACSTTATTTGPAPRAAASPPPAAPATPQPATAYPVIATTMEIRLEPRAAGSGKAAAEALAQALANVTITEFVPAGGVAVAPILGSRVEGTRTITEYARNTYRQLIRTSDHGIPLLAHGQTDPGWYVVHSYGSTAGFDPAQPRKGQRSCVVSGLALAPGVSAVELKPGEAAYFGHFVFTIGVSPGKGAAAPVELTVADARIEPAPAGLDDLLRRNGLDPAKVRRLPAERFPCPWTVPRG